MQNTTPYTCRLKGLSHIKDITRWELDSHRAVDIIELNSGQILTLSNDILVFRPSRDIWDYQIAHGFGDYADDNRVQSITYMPGSTFIKDVFTYVAHDRRMIDVINLANGHCLTIDAEVCVYRASFEDFYNCCNDAGSFIEFPHAAPFMCPVCGMTYQLRKTIDYEVDMQTGEPRDPFISYYICCIQCANKPTKSVKGIILSKHIKG